MVRNTEGLNELIERTRDIPMSPERLRAQRSSFAFGNLNIENPNVTREVIARADADFGSDLRIRLPECGGNCGTETWAHQLTRRNVDSCITN
jgi:hypothetical protein